MKITVYGPGCKKCHEAEDLVKRVVAEAGADHQGFFSQDDSLATFRELGVKF